MSRIKNLIKLCEQEYIWSQEAKMYELGRKVYEDLLLEGYSNEELESKIEEIGNCFEDIFSQTLLLNIHKAHKSHMWSLDLKGGD